MIYQSPVRKGKTDKFETFFLHWVVREEFVKYLARLALPKENIYFESIPLTENFSLLFVCHLCNAVSVTRLIRTAYGDYKLNTIPPGMAIPVPYKPVTNQKAKGSLAPRSPKKKKTKGEERVAQPVQWVTSIQ